MRKLRMEELGRKSVEAFRSSEKFPVKLMLDNIRSMHNVGSVFRTADAFLLEGIVLTGYTPRPPHRDIHKTALGATETVAWTYFPDAKEALDSLLAEGYAIWAVEQTDRSLPLHQFSEMHQPGKLALVFGNEVSGVGQEILEKAQGSIEIPQFGSKHSLNVSVAAGIVAWELIRKMIGS
jgi:tRNA G18 (ribose-2'-O)-methylase SpoU